MSRTNETRFVEWHETCKWEQKFGENVCNNKGFIWNPSSCGCECDKACDVGEYLDY